MSAVRRLPPLLLLLLVPLFLAPSGCGRDGGGDHAAFVWKPVFGDGTRDTGEVIATVGDIEITYGDLQKFLEELSPEVRAGFKGPDGERLALHKMIETAIMVKGAVEMELYNDPDVARTLISLRRKTLDSAMRNYGLLRDRKPSEEEMLAYFQNNRSQYRQLALLNVRDIEVMTKEEADEVYARLREGGKKNNFTLLVHEYSVNEDTKAEDGNCGWFNEGGQFPLIRGGRDFTKQCYQLEDGLNPPFRIADRWHVVEVLDKKPERPMTFKEAHSKLEVDMLPAYQDALIRDYVRAARERYGVTMAGRFAPGQGLTPEQLFTQGMNVADPERRIDIFRMIWTDFPDAKEADDAMFMAANVALEAFQDYKIAERYLNLLIKDYPDSELINDAKFLLDNLGNPAVLNPQSIEELRKKANE